MRKDEIERICRLTPLQDGMFFEALRKQGSSEVVYQVCLELRGEVRPAVLQEAWRSVIRRHPILRTSFHYERLDAPVQVARRNADPPWQVLDWGGVPEAELERKLGDLVEADRRQPFELTRAPLLRLTLICAGTDRAWLIWTYHHLLLDGWSTYRVLDDVSRAYRELSAGRAPDTAPPRPYWEYVAWLQGRDTKGAEEYWRAHLAGVTRPTPLGYEDIPPDAVRAEFGEVGAVLPEDVAAGLETVTRRHRITLGTLLNAAWAVALSRYSGTDDVVFGGIVSGRTPEFDGIDDLVGLFINVLPVRARLRPGEPVLDWLTGFQQQLADARQFDYVPLSTVQRCSELPRGLPLFESLAVFINYPVREKWTDGGGMRITGNRVLQQPHYPLHLTGVNGALGWWLTLGYDPLRFSRTTVSRLLDLVVAVLSAIARRPERPIADLPGWAATAPLTTLAGAGAAPTVPVGELLAAAAVRREDATAVVAGDDRLSYHDLVTAARRTAAEVRAVDGATGAAAAVWCEVRPGTAAAVFGALLAGVPVLPVDPDGPVDGTTRSLVDAGVRVVLHTGDAGPRLTTIAHQASAVLVRVTTEAEPADGGDRPHRVATGDPALLLPHRGDPAGATLRHAELGRLLWRLQRLAALTDDDLVWLAGPPSTVVRDLLWVLAVGGTAVLGGPVGPVTVAHLPAAITGTAPEHSRGLRRVLVRGTLPGNLRTALAGRTELIEEYRGDLAGAAFVSPGWPAPRGCPGEARVRTGDRIFPSSAAETAGRLWSVAAVLTRHPGIRDAVALVRPDLDGIPELVAYLVPDAGGRAASVAELQELVAGRLPAELVPRQFLTLEALPRTADGDVDVDALPAVGSPRGGRGESRDPLLDLVSSIWAQALELPAEALDPASNFFDLGGHSLLAIRLVSRVRAALNVDFSLVHLFADPTITGVAGAVQTLLSGAATGGADDAISPAPRDAPLPASFAQERLWFVDQLGGTANNVMLPSRLAGHTDPELLRAALCDLLDRHEVLRTCLRERDGVMVQEIREAGDPPFEYDDLSGLPVEVAERRARELLEADAAKPFDLGTEVPVRARLIRLGADDCVLGVCVHHAAFDGWSTGVLFRDLGELYQARRAGRPATLPPLPVQYADFSRWQRDRLSGDRLDILTRYWRTELAEMPDELRLRQATRSAGERTGAGGAVQRDMPADLVDAVRRLAVGASGTPFMVLLAAYGVLLGRRAGRDDVVVGSPLAGRDQAALEPLIGLFVNTQVLRLRLAGRPTFSALLDRVRGTCLGALAHRDLPFERLVGLVSPHRRSDRMPLVQVSFNLQNTPYQPLATGGAAATYFPIRQEVPRFELTAELYDWAGGMRVVFHYAEDLYDRAFTERLAEEYVDLIRSLVDAPDRPVPLGEPAGSSEAAGELPDSSRGLLRAMGRR